MVKVKLWYDPGLEVKSAFVDGRFYKPTPASMFRLSRLVENLARKGQATMRPFICVGCIGWSAEIAR